jgi:tetratricopeptide (TPR) repeat protein
MIREARLVFGIAGVLAALLALGCGGAATRAGTADGKPELDADGKPIISAKAREDFDKAAAAYKEAAKSGWNDDNCKKVVETFEKLASRHNNMAEALYNVGVVHKNCRKVSEARAAFEKTLKLYPEHQLSMTHLAVIELEAGRIDVAEEWIRKAVAAGRNTVEAVPAYTIAGTILRNRFRETKTDDNFQKSQRSLRTALAIEAKYLPALYELAMLYFDKAVIEKKPSFLTLSTLVCQQAIRLDPEYGPIYHALGKILLEKQELVEALKAFESAFKKDATLFEAYMTFGAINLNFRGYEAARGAFERAIGLRPDHYDAHMGLGVALRGLEDFEGAKASYKKAAEIDPKRTDYIFNLGLLEMDYLNDGTPAGYEKAAAVFQKFIENAVAGVHDIDPDGKKGPEISWVAKAKARIASCSKAATQIREMEKEMAEMAKMQKEQEKVQKELEEQMKKAEELAKREAEGGSAPQEDVDEAALEAEVEAEAAAKQQQAEAKKEKAKKAPESEEEE